MAGKKWLIFCLTGECLWHAFQCNDSLGPEWKCKDPIAAISLGIPLLGSSEPGDVPAVALQGQNKKPAAVSRAKLLPGTPCTKCSKSSPGGWGDRRRGWASRALSHSSVFKDFRQCTFTKIFSLFKAPFACQLLNLIQSSRAMSGPSCSPFMGTACVATLQGLQSLG